MVRTLVFEELMFKTLSCTKPLLGVRLQHVLQEVDRLLRDYGELKQIEVDLTLLVVLEDCLEGFPLERRFAS